MNKHKTETIQHYEKSIDFVLSLEALTETEWLTEVEKGKWSTAEVIGHFVPWDDFVLQKRIPYILAGDKLPGSPDRDMTNRESALKSRSENKQGTIQQFVFKRQELHKAVYNIPDDRWELPITIGQKSLTLHAYFSGLAEHDCHHFKQIRKAHPHLI